MLISPDSSEEFQHLKVIDFHEAMIKIFKGE